MGIGTGRLSGNSAPPSFPRNLHDPPSCKSFVAQRTIMISTAPDSPVETPTRLIPPYGGRLVNLLVDEAQQQELKAYATHLPSIQLSLRMMCDLELLAVGAFSPLDRFMGQQDFQRVLDEMRLSNGLI